MATSVERETKEPWSEQGESSPGPRPQLFLVNRQLHSSCSLCSNRTQIFNSIFVIHPWHFPCFSECLFIGGERVMESIHYRPTDWLLSRLWSINSIALHQFLRWWDYPPKCIREVCHLPKPQLPPTIVLEHLFPITLLSLTLPLDPRRIQFPGSSAPSPTTSTFNGLSFANTTSFNELHHQNKSHYFLAACLKACST